MTCQLVVGCLIFYDTQESVPGISLHLVLLTVYYLVQLQQLHGTE